MHYPDKQELDFIQSSLAAISSFSLLMRKYPTDCGIMRKLCNQRPQPSRHGNNIYHIRKKSFFYHAKPIIFIATDINKPINVANQIISEKVLNWKKRIYISQQNSLDFVINV